jgi:DNA adenine methylase
MKNPPIKSPLSGWLGGKFQLSKRIITLIPEHQCYCEPFAGAAWVFFKKQRSEVEVLNDINTEIITLYRVVQNHLDEFIRHFRWLLVSRNEFERFLKVDPTTLTDVQRAIRFFYLQKSSYGGRIQNASFGYAPTAHPRLNLLRIEEELSASHLRLAQAYIENLPYGNLISRYDREGTFFYIDPPYWDCENDYGKNIFCKDDFAKLVIQLATIKGKFLLSLNDTPEIRELFKAFIFDEAEVVYSVGKSRNKNKELLIRNY